MKVLIIDDSRIIRRNLVKIFEKLGYDVVAEADNGLSGIEEYKKHKPDVVTMDITMPLMDGIEAVKEIIRIDPKSKIIIVSALNQKKMIFEALENGAKHYIVKPITFDKVKEVIEEVNEYE